MAEDERVEDKWEDLNHITNETLERLRSSADKIAEENRLDQTEVLTHLVHEELVRQENDYEDQESLRRHMEQLSDQEIEERQRRIRNTLENEGVATEASEPRERPSRGTTARAPAARPPRETPAEEPLRDTPVRDRRSNTTRQANRFVRRRRGVTSLWIAFWYTLLWHVVLILMYGSVTSVTGLFILLLLLVLLPTSIMYIFWHRHEPGEIREALLTTAMTFVVYLIPFFVGDFFTSGSEISNLVSYLVFYIPVWPLFMIVKLQDESKTAHYLLRIWEVGLFFVIIICMALFLQTFGFQALSGVDLGSPTNVVSGAWSFTTSFFGTMWDYFTGTMGIVKRITDPNYYTGQVEENAEVPLGVELQELRPADKIVGLGSPIYAFGTVRARPIKGDGFLEESVLVRPTCVMEREDAPAADVDPYEMDIVWGTFGQFECEFPPPEKRGTYAIVGAVTFPFVTMSYIEYHFINDETARNMAFKGEDIHQKLGIQENPIARYTGGPVQLGMGGTPQPIVIRLNEDEILPPGVNIGFTLDSKWREGKIGTVEKLELKVPKPFRLADCSRDPVNQEGEQDPIVPLYNTWTFANPKLDGISDYASVNCKLILDDKEAASVLVNSKNPVRSFVAVAHYTYTVEEKTSVQVR